MSGGRQANTGSAGALARPSVPSTLNLKPLDTLTVISRFALMAGEGARAPSINWLVPDRIDLLGKAGLVKCFSGNLLSEKVVGQTRARVILIGKDVE
jgi:hypothetical protein